MKKFKKGDIVSRASYNNDILFFVEKLINDTSIGKLAILKGLTIRIEADAPIDDLELASESRIHETIEYIDERIENDEIYRTAKKLNSYGRILHLDGDSNFVYIDKSLQIQGFKK